MRRAPGLDYTCRECGRGGAIHSSRRCFGCVLAERARLAPAAELPASVLADLTGISISTAKR